MERQNPPGLDVELEERAKRASEKIAAVLKEERLKIALPTRIVPGPDGWFKPVASLKFVEDKG